MSNDKFKQASVNQKKHAKYKYSLLTVVLLICIIELVVSNIQNISKNINYTAKIRGLQAKKAEEVNKNKQLKSEIENYNSDVILESIARNNLKMAGQDEILIIMNNSKDNAPQEVEVTNKNIFHFGNKKEKNKEI